MKGLIYRTLVALPLLGVLSGAALAQEAVAGRPVDNQTGFQVSVTPLMDEIESFYNNLLLWVVVAIVLVVLVLLAVIVFRFNDRVHPVPSKTTHNTLLEVAWTVVPILVLVIVAIPSFGILTDQETIPDGARKYLGGTIYNFGTVEVPAASLTIKATGNQWFWSYEYTDLKKHYNSNILAEADRQKLKPTEPRLLAVDNDLVVPVDTTVRVEVTGADVIHSFSVPSFGVKIDAVPGRLNETWFNVRKTGIYYGQCSQLCGKDHAFMPIAVRVVTKDQYAAWSKALAVGNVDKANATLPPLDANS